MAMTPAMKQAFLARMGKSAPKGGGKSFPKGAGKGTVKKAGKDK